MDKFLFNQIEYTLLVRTKRTERPSFILYKSSLIENKKMIDRINISAYLHRMGDVFNIVVNPMEDVNNELLVKAKEKAFNY